MQLISQSKMHFIALAALFLSGCATTAHELSAPAGASLGIQEARVDTQASLNKSVRWGGMIVDVENTNGQARVEIIAQPLQRDGQPDFRQTSEGRFIAVFDQFLEPNDYKTSSQITVVGLITGTENGKVGQADYQYPVVGITDHQLWQTDNVRYAGRPNNRYGSHNGRGGYYGNNSYYGYDRHYSRGGFFGHNSFYGGFFPRFSISLGGRFGILGYSSRFKGRHKGRGGYRGRSGTRGRSGSRGNNGFRGRGSRR